MFDFFDNRNKYRKPGFLRGNIYTSCISMVLLDHFANKSNTFQHPLSLGPHFLFPRKGTLQSMKKNKIHDDRVNHDNNNDQWSIMIIMIIFDWSDSYPLPASLEAAPCPAIQRAAGGSILSLMPQDNRMRRGGSIGRILSTSILHFGMW